MKGYDVKSCGEEAGNSLVTNFIMAQNENTAAHTNTLSCCTEVIKEFTHYDYTKKTIQLLDRSKSFE